MSKKISSKIIIFISFALLTNACTSVQGVQQARGSGTKKIYKKSISEVWTAMKKAVINTGGTIKKENKETCSILAEYGVTLTSWGERVGVFCYKKPSSNIEVEVVSKRALAVNITASDWTTDIYQELDKELNSNKQ